MTSEIGPVDLAPQIAAVQGVDALGEQLHQIVRTAAQSLTEASNASLDDLHTPLSTHPALREEWPFTFQLSNENAILTAMRRHALPNLKDLSGIEYRPLINSRFFRDDIVEACGPAGWRLSFITHFSGWLTAMQSRGWAFMATTAFTDPAEGMVRYSVYDYNEDDAASLEARERTIFPARHYAWAGKLLVGGDKRLIQAVASRQW